METVQRRPRLVELPGNRKNLAKSGTRALDVLEFVAQCQRPVRAVEVANALHLQPSSADQLLKTLVDSGYLLFERVYKHYLPSPRLIRFSMWLSEYYYGSDNLVRLLSALSLRSGELVTLAAPQGDVMQIVDFVDRPEGPDTVQKGLKVAMLRSALGITYLASLSRPDLRHLLARLEAEQGHAALHMAETSAWIEDVRKRRYASGGLGAGSSAWSITMALPKAQNETSLVLGVSGVERRIRSREAELVEIMRNAIEEFLT
jgi:DNA-binding IclR family transcriptional regulator